MTPTVEPTVEPLMGPPLKRVKLDPGSPLGSPPVSSPVSPPVAGCPLNLDYHGKVKELSEREFPHDFEARWMEVFGEDHDPLVKDDKGKIESFYVSIVKERRDEQGFPVDSPLSTLWSVRMLGPLAVKTSQSPLLPPTLKENAWNPHCSPVFVGRNAHQVLSKSLFGASSVTLFKMPVTQKGLALGLLLGPAVGTAGLSLVESFKVCKDVSRAEETAEETRLYTLASLCKTALAHHKEEKNAKDGTFAWESRYFVRELMNIGIMRSDISWTRAYLPRKARTRLLSIASLGCLPHWRFASHEWC